MVGVDNFSMSEDIHKLKDQHDELLAAKPSSATHDSQSCPLCELGSAAQEDHQSGGSMPESYSQSEVDAAIALATASLQERLADLESQAQQTEVGKAVAEAVTAKDASIADLQQQLDAAVAEKTAAENRLTETDAFWTQAVADHVEAEALATARTERVAQAKAAGALPDEYVEANADRFAAMTAEDWTARLDEWRLIAAKGPTPSATGIPTHTALTASAAPAAGAKPDSALAHIFEMRAAHVDPRTLGGAR